MIRLEGIDLPKIHAYHDKSRRGGISKSKPKNGIRDKIIKPLYENSKVKGNNMIEKARTINSLLEDLFFPKEDREKKIPSFAEAYGLNVQFLLESAWYFDETDKFETIYRWCRRFSKDLLK